MSGSREYDPCEAEVGRRLRAQLDAALNRDLIKREHEQHLREFGLAILNAGISLIPSDVLADNQVIVSQDVYDATVRALNGEDGPGHAYFTKRRIPR